jgi:hypothetical protein
MFAAMVRLMRKEADALDEQHRQLRRAQRR